VLTLVRDFMHQCNKLNTGRGNVRLRWKGNCCMHTLWN